MAVQGKMCGGEGFLCAEDQVVLNLLEGSGGGGEVCVRSSVPAFSSTASALAVGTFWNQEK